MSLINNQYPTWALDPVTGSVMTCPVQLRAPCKHTMDKSTFAFFLEVGSNSCPVCQKPLTSLSAKVDKDLAKKIEDLMYCQPTTTTTTTTTALVAAEKQEQQTEQDDGQSSTESSETQLEEEEDDECPEKRLSNGTATSRTMMDDSLMTHSMKSQCEESVVSTTSNMSMLSTRSTLSTTRTRKGMKSKITLLVNKAKRKLHQKAHGVPVLKTCR